MDNGEVRIVKTLYGVLNTGGGIIGTENYDKLRNKPSIEGVTLEGDISLRDLGIIPLSNERIAQILNS